MGSFKAIKAMLKVVHFVGVITGKFVVQYIGPHQTRLFAF